jgi:DNA-binding beta-propeller fold protein YncE
MRRHPRIVPLVVLLVLAGCGTATRSVSSVARQASDARHQPRPQPAPTPAGAVVHLQGHGGITTVALAGPGRWDAPGGIATPDWSTIFTVAGGELRTLDGVTGAVRASQPVAPGLRPVVTSPDGQLVALADTPVRIGQSVFPPGRTRSTIVIAPASPASGQPRNIQLDGNIVPEAFSTDHARLFAIEFLPPAQPDRYRVRSVDMASGVLGPVYTFDKDIDTEIMQGLSRTQVLVTTGTFGQMLYTLYSRADGPAAGYGDLHALSLSGGLVHCTDFPSTLRIGPDGGAIVASPDGQHVYVANRSGTLAEVDASGSSSAEFPIAYSAQLAVAAPTTLALAADEQHLWVALGTTLYGLDAATLKVVSTMTMPHPVEALAVTVDGTLYAASSISVERVDPASSTTSPVTTLNSSPTRIAVV